MANEKRLIDANPIVQFIMDGLNNPDKMKALGHDAIEILAEIEYAPTVDAVEVVRCKDCENRVYVDNGDEIGEIGGCKLFKMAMPYDSFCSYGKRRSTENV